jgi:rhamnosyltransferase
LEDISSSGVSVVIPTLNAARYIPPLLDAIHEQLPKKPDEIVLVDSHSSDDTRRLSANYTDVKFVTIDKFSHGAARNLGARAAGGDYVVFLSQDALPANPHWLRNLLQPFKDPAVAAAYSRQVPYDHANPMEQFFLSSRFPPGKAAVRKVAKGGALSLPDVFFSNVSSAARRDVLLKFPFDEKIIMSEDQKFSFDLLQAGYKVVYQPESIVVHSHDYTLKIVFQRYFDSVYSLTEIFDGHGVGTTLSMGSSYSLGEFLHIIKNHPRWLPYYFLYFTAKTGGTLFGHAAPWIPLRLKRRMSLHSYHWD